MIMPCPIDYLCYTTAKGEEKKEGRHPQLTPHPPFAGEELSGHEHIHMDTDKLPPRYSFLPLRGWGNTMAFEDVADRLVTDGIAQVGQSTHDAVIAPRAVLPGHAHHQVLYLLRRAGTADCLASLGAIALVFDEPAVPGEDGCRLHNGSDLLKRLLAQLHTNLGKGLAIAICELHATPDVLTENAILGYQVHIA